MSEEPVARLTPLYYANETRINSSGNDFRLTFFENIAIGQNPPDPQVRCSVAMSPQQYKLLTKVMLEQLNFYENLFGPINIDPNPSILAQVATASEGPKVAR